MNYQEKNQPSVTSDEIKLSFSAQIIGLFLSGPLSLLIMVVALLAGGAALILTPREEEPQIVVPLADIFVSAPGLSAEQVERQVATPLEKLLYQVDGVEYVYSMSRQGQTIVTVRFYVGENREASLVKLYNKIHSNVDQVPPEITAWVVKPIEIDDVPIVIATLWSRDPKKYDDHALRRLAEEAEIKLQSIPDTNRITISGGRPRTIRVELVPANLASHRTTPLDIEFALKASNVRFPVGEFEQLNKVVSVQAGDFIRSIPDLENLVVNVIDGIPVYLKDVAKISDGAAEIENYTWIGFGPASQNNNGPELYPAVSLAIAKKKGSNAVWVARDIEKKLEELKASFFPPEVEIQITRNYGETANEKVNDLVEGLAVAVLTVIIFIGLFLGWRAALVIALAIPICYGATLAFNLLGGYTINRVTLFALILALGILVDDPITDVENIARYFSMRRFKARMSVLLAVQEVRPALVLSTVAVILCFVPMFFITGMMGPYMAPMALNVPLTMLMSMLVAFFVTPYLSLKLLRQSGTDVNTDYDVRKTFIYRIYNRVLRPVIRSRSRSWLFLGFVLILFFISVGLPAFRKVPLKMLPFDNKNEFQILVDNPEGTTLEQTDRILRELSAYLRTVPEVTDFVLYSGHASPMDFNGMVRHYYLRQESHSGDIRVQLLDKSLRKHQSHEIVLRIRKDLERIGNTYQSNVKIIEVPPGPPVISTITTEIYGDDQTPYSVLQEAALQTAERLRKATYVVDVDTSVEADQDEILFVTDKEKAALSGVATEDIARTLQIALSGTSGYHLQFPSEAHPLEISLRLPRTIRSSTIELGNLYVKGRPGITKIRQSGSITDAPQPIVPIHELGTFKPGMVDKTIYHKNLHRVAYVFAEMAGLPPAEAVLDTMADYQREGTVEPRPLEGRTFFKLGAGLPWETPEGTRVVWNGEGEWKITLDVFRDLGIAFGVALLGIFLVLMIETGSAVLTIIIMSAIPLTMIGIMPGFWFLNMLGETMIGGYPNPTFFTATAMIGMIALAGIVVRNSVVLIDFIHHALQNGLDLEEALVQSGAIRLRPIFLTAGTTLLGNIVITLDPIFSGLAWAIIFGISASTVFTLGVIPVVYNLVFKNKPRHGLSISKEGSDT